MVPENPVFGDRIEQPRRRVAISAPHRARYLRSERCRQEKTPPGGVQVFKEETPMTGNERLSNHHPLPTPESASGAFSQSVLPFRHNPVTGQPRHRIVQAPP